MVFCVSCDAEVEGVDDEANGFTCCAYCGRVLEDIAFASDVQFAKGGDGSGGMMGQMVGESGQVKGLGRFSGGQVWASNGDNHESAVARGRMEIAALVENFGISPPSEAVGTAHRLYKLALQSGFTRGRRVNQVAATCLYIFCRQERKPYMLIDFSDHLSINVYTLGAVYLQLLRLFHLDEYPTLTKPIDPSLYLHRFSDRLLFGKMTQAVSSTALKLVQSMKRDWMQTGRRPSGICGAALFIAAHIHGFQRTKREIISVVHVGWSTVEKRVLEFANSGVGDLTVKDFEERAKLFEEERAREIAAREQALLEQPPPDAPGELAIVESDANMDDQTRRRLQQQRTGACEHVNVGTPSFAYGMCRRCYEEYLDVSGGVFQGAADPPAFTKGLQRELKQMLALPAPEDEPVKQLRQRGEEEEEAPASRNPLLRDKSQMMDPEEEEELHDMDEALKAAELRKLAAVAERVAGVGEEGEAGGATHAVAGSGQERAAKRARLSEGEGGGTQQATQAYGAGEGRGQGAASGQGGAQGGDPDATQPVEGVQGPPTQAAQGGAEGVGAAGTLDGVSGAIVQVPQASTGAGADGEGGSQGKKKKKKKKGRPKGGDGEADGEGGEGGEGERADKDGQREGEESGSSSGSEEEEEEEKEKEEEDVLSEMSEGEMDMYIASKEEAELKDLLWTEMNKEWIEKQAAKAALAALAGPDEAKPKRTGQRRKAKSLPPAETAGDAAKNMLEAKKLSNKINYSALSDLFSDPSAEPQGEAGQDGQPSAAAAFEDEYEEPSVTAALRKRAEQRAAEQQQDLSRYSRALQDEQSKRGGGGLGGGFLSSLTFASGSKDGSGGRQRPQGLGTRLRGK